MPVGLLYDAVGWTFLMFVKDDMPDMVGGDTARGWVLDGRNRAFDCGIEGGVLEGKTTIVAEGAVFQLKVGAIAQRLQTVDMATNKPKVAAIPP